VGEQHHVSGRSKGHEEKKEQSVQKEVSKTTACAKRVGGATNRTFVVIHGVPCACLFEK